MHPVYQLPSSRSEQRALGTREKPPRGVPCWEHVTLAFGWNL